VKNAAWVTGAKGFIGRHLCRYLAKGGTKVYGIGHGAWSIDDARAWGVHDWTEGEISNSSLNVLLLKATEPPARIYHLAGGASVGAAVAAPYDDFNRTVATTASLLEWMRKNAGSTTLVAISSAAVYGAGHSGQIPENAEKRPYSPYGFHKLAMEQVCRAYAQSFSLPITIVRLFSVYGPMLKKQLLWDICGQLAQTPSFVPLGGTGNELRDWTHIEDIIQLLDLAAGQANGSASPMNAGTGIATSVRIIAEHLREAWGSSAKFEFSGISRRGDPESLIADPQVFQGLGFDCRKQLADGMIDYVAWYKQYNGIS
jgi:UDP-glucose 4-epimerase